MPRSRSHRRNEPAPAPRPEKATSPAAAHAPAGETFSFGAFLSRPVVAALVLVALVGIAYFPAFRAGFIWDDDDHFTHNSAVISDSGLVDIWTTSSAIYYPLVLTTWWFLRRLVGLNPFAYHALNILLHVANALLLAASLRRWRIPGGWVAAALFALHPVQVETVAWATELKNLQSGLFFLLAILFFGRFADVALDAEASRGRDAGDGARDGARARRRAYGLSLCFFLAALVSKPSVVMLPVVLFVLLAWREGRLPWRRIGWIAPFLALSLLASGWTIWEQKYHSNAQGPEWSETLMERMQIAGRVVWFYLWKLAWPHPLVFIYPRWRVEAGNLAGYVPLLGCLALTAVAWWKRRGWGWPVLLVWLAYTALLFPVLGFFNIYFTRFSYVGDHFQYLATLAAFTGAGAAAVAMHSRVSAGAARGLLGVGVGVLVVLAVLSWRQSRIYHDEESLWRDTLARNPAAWIAHNNLGLALAERGDFREARGHYEAAIALKPDYEEAFNNLGIVLAEEGDYAAAVEQYKKAIQFRPEFAIAYDNLGGALAELGRLDQAESAFRMAVRLNPGDAVTRCNHGEILGRLGRLGEAIEQFEAAVRLNPSDPRMREALERALERERAGERARRRAGP